MAWERDNNPRYAFSVLAVLMRGNPDWEMDILKAVVVLAFLLRVYNQLNLFSFVFFFNQFLFWNYNINTSFLSSLSSPQTFPYTSFSLFQTHGFLHIPIIVVVTYLYAYICIYIYTLLNATYYYVCMFSGLTIWHWTIN